MALRPSAMRRRSTRAATRRLTLATAGMVLVVLAEFVLFTAVYYRAAPVRQQRAIITVLDGELQSAQPGSPALASAQHVLSLVP